MKVLTAYDWLEKYKKNYPNGTEVSKMMDDYALYYHEETKKYEHLMGMWKSEWYNKYRLLDINFEVFCKMVNYPNSDHDKHLRGDHNPGSL